MDGGALPCPADPGAAGGGGRPGGAGEKRRGRRGGRGWGKTGLKQSWRGSLDPGETGAVLESGGAEQPEGPAGLRAVLSDRPLEGG